MCKKGHFLLKDFDESFIKKCQTFIYQKFFSEFDYLYYFTSSSNVANEMNHTVESIGLAGSLKNQAWTNVIANWWR